MFISLYSNACQSRKVQAKEYEEKLKCAIRDCDVKCDQVVRKCDAMLRQKTEECEGQVMQARISCAETVRVLEEKHKQELEAARKTVFNEKESLAQLSEKELLVETVYSLHNNAPLWINTAVRKSMNESERIAAISENVDRITREVAKSNSCLAVIDSEVGQLVKRERRREKVENAFGYVLTEESFSEIVESVARRHEFRRISECVVDGALIKGLVTSVNGGSTWRFRIDFNRNGEITGEYTYSSDNDDSSLPQYFADAIRKEIVYILHNASEDE